MVSIQKEFDKAAEERKETKEDIKEIRGDIKEIKEDISEMKMRLRNLERRVMKIEDILTEHGKELRKMDNKREVTRIKKDLLELKKKDKIDEKQLSNLEKRVERLELKFKIN